MKAIVQFFVNIWNAQQNERLLVEVSNVNVRLIASVKEFAIENAALRAQIPVRGEGGKFSKKTTQK